MVPDIVHTCSAHGDTLVAFPARDAQIGEFVEDKYEIKGRIGAGGMGTVYRASQRYIKRDVALKVLKPELVQDIVAVRRFFTEARAASRLTSRHSVVVHDFGATSDGLLFYTMEYVPGVSLGREIDESGSLAPERAVRIAADVCRSLEDAHERGVVHRDLKPDNIILAEFDGRETGKVLDFGIAKILTGEDGNTLTPSGMVCGTPKYVSPEQASGAVVGPASDLYSLGVVLYEMLAGKPPFAGGSPGVLLMKHIREIPVPLSRCLPAIGVSQALERLVTGLLAKQPYDRPVSAAAVRDLLEQLLEHGVRAGPEQVKQSENESAFRVTEPLMGGEPDSETELACTDEEHFEQDHPHGPAERRSRVRVLALVLLAAAVVAFAAYFLETWGSKLPVDQVAPPVSEESLPPEERKSLPVAAGSADFDTGGVVADAAGESPDPFGLGTAAIKDIRRHRGRVDAALRRARSSSDWDGTRCLENGVPALESLVLDAERTFVGLRAANDAHRAHEMDELSANLRGLAGRVGQAADDLCDCLRTRPE